MVILFLGSCADKKKNTDLEELNKENTLDSATVAAKNMFEINCSGCHGRQMEAFADRKWKHGKEFDSIKKSISEGYVERYGVEKIALTSDTLVTEKMTLKLDTIFSGIEVPWDMDWLPNGDMLVTDRDGQLFRIDEAGKQYTIEGVPQVRIHTQAGLFNVLPHPNFEENNFVYLSYANPKIVKNDTTTTTMVRRYKLQEDKLSEGKLILEAGPYNKRHVHFGARMLFDKENHLFVTVGDRGMRDDNPQDLTRVAGSVHRFNDDGSIPEDNPFLNLPDAIKSIYSYGHRNPQGIAFHPETGELWEHEHGPRGGDEINIIKPGKNYGWPLVSYGINYNGTIFTNLLEKEGMQSPQHYWTPSIAPSGMTFVTSNKYPDWEGNILAGSLRFEYLNRCVIEDDKVVKEEQMFEGIGRLRNVEEGPDGYLYRF